MDRARKLTIGILIISMVGLVAGMLSYDTYRSVEAEGQGYCTLGGNCAVLYNVPEASVLGIHFSVLAPIYFGVLTILSIALLTEGLREPLQRLVTALYIIGLPFIPYLVYVEHKYGLICIYCTIMHIMIVTGSILGIWSIRAETSGTR